MLYSGARSQSGDRCSGPSNPDTREIGAEMNGRGEIRNTI